MAAGSFPSGKEPPPASAEAGGGLLCPSRGRSEVPAITLTAQSVGLPVLAPSMFIENGDEHIPCGPAGSGDGTLIRMIDAAVGKIPVDGPGAGGRLGPTGASAGAGLDTGDRQLHAAV